jgi:hypothetical protein
MSIGRGTATLAALALTAALVGTAAEATAAHPAKKRTKIVLFKARVFSDGSVTPGQTETVTVAHMPQKTSFKLAIEAPPTTLQCGQLYFCDLAPVSPAPGSAPFQTNKHGKALVSFVMPSTYNIATDPFADATRRPVAFANDQRVHIDVEGVKRLHLKKKIGFGFGRTIVRTG